jgi:prepilin-type processing-associated H-X9-DG protein
MSQPITNCPSCGAPVQFRWSSAAQTVCPFCRSILVRTDIDLQNVGKVADLPPSPSPIQLQTEGTYRGKAFQVLGRIIYEYENGGWNEWHIVFSDGTSGWLSDAQLQYAISFLVDPGVALPPKNAAFRGKEFTFHKVQYAISTVTIATYKGVEGELPFPFYGKSNMLFADLHSSSRAFGTIDYSEDPPLLFLGEWVEFEELQLKNLKQFEGWV